MSIVTELRAWQALPVPHHVSSTTVNGIPLLMDSPTAGAVFDLTGPAGADADITYDAGWSLHLRAGAATAVVRGCGARGLPFVAPASWAAAVRGLDLIYANDGPAYALSKASEEFIVFWPEGGHLRLTWQSTHRPNLSMRGTLTVVHADGTEHAPPPRRWVHHSSFTHYRRSQLETDVGDAYRHAYLALEAILDTIRPQSPGESEGGWLINALIDAHRILNPRDSEQEHRANAQRRWRSWYDEERNSLFHSKPSRVAVLHPEIYSHDVLLDKMDKILRMYLDLARRCLNVVNGKGGFASDHAIENMLSALDASDLRIRTIDDSDLRQESASTVLIREVHGELPAREGFFICNRMLLPASRRVKRWEATHAGELYFWTELDNGVIELDPLDTLSVRYRTRFGGGDFKQRYLT